MSLRQFLLNLPASRKITTAGRVSSCKWGQGGFYILIFLILLSSTTQAQYATVGQFQLAPPTIEVAETFFDAETSVRLDLDVDGVVLRYAIGNKEVSENSAIYEDPISIRTSTTITAKAFHPDYQDSEVVRVSVYRIAPKRQLNVAVDPLPAPQYAGKGALLLSDQKKGSMNFRDGRWLGFSADTTVFQLEGVSKVERLTLSIMEDHGSWIFAPSRVEVWQGQNLLGSSETTAPNTFSSKTFRFVEVPLNRTANDVIEVKVIMDGIPEWHDGQGTTPWLFIDEIFISN